MHQTAQDILSLFSKTGSELSTSQIIESINEKYSLLKKDELNPQSKREIAKLHRKTLHHLNKLLDLGILSLTRHGEKGEKFFVLKLKDNEEIMEFSPNYKKRILVSKPLIPLMPIEGYEQKGIVLKYEPATWIDRLNSIIIFSQKFQDLKRLDEILSTNIFPIVNDAISLENFEEIINEQEVNEFLEKLNKDCQDYGKVLNVVINLRFIKNRENLQKMLSLIEEKKTSNINFIFGIYGNLLNENKDLLKIIIEVFSKNRTTLNIKNILLHSAPYFLGRAGPYCLSEKEWQLAESIKKTAVCLGCSQSTAVVDVNKFYLENGLDIKQFSQLMFNVSKSIFSANTLQRMKSEDYFRNISQLNIGFESDFLDLSRNYIRFWNFGLHQPDLNQELILNMINEAKKKIDEFSAAEETIYKSCGMTTRFKLALSCAFVTSLRLSEAKYEKLEIMAYDDINQKTIKRRLQEKEATFQIFNGGDEITFHLTKLFDMEDYLNLIDRMLSSYKFPLFNLSFEKLKGNIKITDFI